MIPSNSWRWFEPRFGFPIFVGVRTYVSFSVRPDFIPFEMRKLHHGVGAAAKRGTSALLEFAKERVDLIRFCRGKSIRFRLILTDREGVFLNCTTIQEPVPPGGSIDVDVNELRTQAGIDDQDLMGILVMSNGRHDMWRSSPGSYSMTYVGEKIYTTYRTGGFARSLNDPRKKSHHGFRGINPKAMATDRYLSSILLINHSSNPGYDSSVSPQVRLVRKDGCEMESHFGEIPPFGCKERSLLELFGSEVFEFLLPTQGRATTVITCPNVTLASLHVLRAMDGTSMALEHSRPSHTYILHGVRE